MLFDSLHCKGLVIHMYFLDEKCVLIFKTDNNKMLYLKIMCFEFISGVFIQFQWDIQTEYPQGLIRCFAVLHCQQTFLRCTNNGLPYSGTNPVTRQTY